MPIRRSKVPHCDSPDTAQVVSVTLSTFVSHSLMVGVHRVGGCVLAVLTHDDRLNTRCSGCFFSRNHKIAASSDIARNLHIDRHDSAVAHEAFDEGAQDSLRSFGSVVCPIICLGRRRKRRFAAARSSFSLLVSGVRCCVSS